MSPARLRALLRWPHIVIGLLIGTYICSTLHLDPKATFVVRLSLLPLVALTGVAMWQQGRLSRSLKPSRSQRLSPARN